MRARVRLAGGVVVSVAILLLAAAATASAAGGSFLLTARDQGKSYAPTFTGNGLLGARIPATGQGYAGGTVPAQSELAGFYARPSKGKASQLVQQRANIPTWSTLTFSDGRTPSRLTPGPRPDGASRSICTPESSPRPRAGRLRTATSPT